MILKNSILCFILLCGICSSVLAESRIEIKKSVIKGNSELPKVMYIIPWQSTLTKDVFKGVELENYYEQLLRPFHPHHLVINKQNID